MPNELLDEIGTFLAEPSTHYMMGRGAQALTADDPTGWRHQVGRLGAEMAQSKIASKAAQRQAQDRASYQRMLTSLLSGKAMTPAGEAGPTTANLTVNEKGEQKITVAGDKIVPTGGSKVGSTKTPTKAPAQAAAPQNIGANRLLPLHLAASTSGSGGGGSGGGESLYGLSPEQIGNITKQDIAGGALSQAGMGEIFSNLQKQAYTDYIDKLPQARAGTRIPPANLPQKISGETKTWWTYDQNLGRSIDTGIKATAEELAGTGPKASYQVTEMTSSNGMRRRVVLKDGVPFRDLGPYPEDSTETRAAMASAEDLDKWEAIILGKSDDTPTPQTVNNFNKFSKANHIYIVRKVGKVVDWWPDDPDDIEKINLPKGVAADDVYFTMEQMNKMLPPGRKMSLEDVIANVRRQGMPKPKSTISK